MWRVCRLRIRIAWRCSLGRWRGRRREDEVRTTHDVSVTVSGDLGMPDAPSETEVEDLRYKDVEGNSDLKDSLRLLEGNRKSGIGNMVPTR